MKTLHKLLIGSAAMLCANLAGAQATDTSTMPATTTMPATSTMPAMPATQVMPAATMPSTAPTSNVSNDPFVQKRMMDKAAKDEYKAKKQASKAEYKEEKRAAKSELKAEKRESKAELKQELATQPKKTDLPYEQGK